MDDAEHADTEETEVAPVAGEAMPDSGHDPEPPTEDDAPPVDESAEEASAAGEPESSELVPGSEPSQVTASADENEEPTAPLTLDELVAEISEVEPAEAAETAEDEEPVEGEEGETEAAEGEEPASEEESEEPESDEESEAEEEYGPTPVVSRMWARVPFWIIGVVWAVFAGALGYMLWPVSAGVFVTDPLYPYFVFGGATLVALGLVTGLIVWLVARAQAEGDERIGLGRILWMRALSWTAGGVALWWVALIALDLHRTGVIR